MTTLDDRMEIKEGEHGLDVYLDGVWIFTELDPRVYPHLEEIEPPR